MVPIPSDKTRALDKEVLTIDRARTGTCTLLGVVLLDIRLVIRPKMICLRLTGDLVNVVGTFTQLLVVQRARARVLESIPLTLIVVVVDYLAVGVGD